MNGGWWGWAPRRRASTHRRPPPPPLSGSTAPAHLDGTLPGDYGRVLGGKGGVWGGSATGCQAGRGRRPPTCGAHRIPPHPPPPPPPYHCLRFDPLNLGADPKALRWMVHAELIHARYAMAAAAGVLIPEALTKAGALSIPAWWEAGKVSTEQTGIPLSSLLVVQARRQEGWEGA